MPNPALTKSKDKCSTRLLIQGVVVVLSFPPTPLDIYVYLLTPRRSLTQLTFGTMPGVKKATAEASNERVKSTRIFDITRMETCGIDDYASGHPGVKSMNNIVILLFSTLFLSPNRYKARLSNKHQVTKREGGRK